MENQPKTAKEIKDQYFIEHFVTDKELISEYKELFKPFKQRGRYMLFYTTFLCIGLFYYAKNVTYYAEKFYFNKRKGIHNLFLLSIAHSLGFTFLLIGGNCLIMGINPRKFYQKYRELDEKILSKDPNPDMTVDEFFTIINREFFQKKSNSNKI